MHCANEASQLLLDWVELVINELGNVMPQHVLKSFSNFRLDLRRALEALWTVLREWCIFHLISKIFIVVFGSQFDQPKGESPIAYSFIEFHRETVENVNKNELLSLHVKEQIFELLSNAFKLLNLPSHRCSAIKDVLFQILAFWELLSITLANQDMLLQISSHRTIILER